MIVAFSFTSGAYDEVARVSLLDELSRLEIKLKTVREVLKESQSITSDLTVSISIRVYKPVCLPLVLEKA